MMNKKSFEYVVKAKNTEIEYELSKKFEFKLLINCIIYLLLIPFLIYRYNSNIGNILLILVILFKFVMEIKETLSKLRKIKLEDKYIFINTRNKEYKFSYEDLINIGFAVEPLLKKYKKLLLYRHYVYIYYLKNNEIKEYVFGISRQDLEKIKEICSIFITNYNTENLNENEYYNVRTKEKDEIINKVLRDEIIW